MSFEALRLAAPILRAVAEEGYHVPTPIQIQAIPHLLAGRDLLACAQTGTGKTAAFALPILHVLSASGQHAARGRKPRSLVLSPTRELALQITASFQAYGRHTRLRQVAVYGGVSQQPQTRALGQGIDVLIATPGRLLDLVQQRFVDLSQIESLVLDEADRMLDMGFIHDIRKIVARLPARRQTMLFSATIPPDIRQLAGTVLRDPVHVQVAPSPATTGLIEQSVAFVDQKHKPSVLAHFLRGAAVTRSLVFTRTKHGADRVVRQLGKSGIAAEAIHGNKTQAARQRALENFRSRATRVLVATDVAARGLDVDDISHVVNYDLPNVPETYVHRIGRTGRAGASGTALSFCDSTERAQLKAIEKLLRQSIPVQAVQPEVATAAASAAHPAAARSSAPRAKSSGFGEGRAQKPAGAAKRKRFAVAGPGSRRNAQRAY